MSIPIAHEVQIEEQPGSSEGVRILKVAGPLTINNFFTFQDRCRKDPPKILIIDLSGTPFIDSAALGSIIGVHVSSEKAGRKYALVGVPERLRSLFAMTGVNDLLITYPTIADAEAALLQTVNHGKLS
ncbi:MAG: STAS domain-containing protein [Acidobacteriaceae bacterium]|nr:STAS domain-containing protein [Acidobacteriaceae bacterium]